MRYVLRNKQKISDNLGPDILDRLIDSLECFVKESEKGDIDKCIYPKVNKEPYDTLLIGDTGNDNKMIAFYIVSITYDVYKLAFKEFLKC